MAWFGSTRLLQLSDKISNFTKEVLSEGTEEVVDHATELQIVKNRLKQFESTCLLQKSEIDNLNHVISDLHLKLESTELQVNSISNEYRALLQQKEEELKRFKQEYHQQLENGSQSNLLENSIIGLEQYGSSSKHVSANSLDEQHFTDLISSQREINKLREQINRLEAEKKYWKESASPSRTMQTDGHSSDESLTESHLRLEIQKLRQQLSNDIDRHQMELTELQDAHSQQLATLKQHHKEELDKQKKQQEFDDRSLETVGHNVKRVSGNDNDDDIESHDDDSDLLKDRICRLEDINEKLSIDLELTFAADREKVKRLEENKRRIGDLENRIDKISQENRTMKEENLRLEKDFMTFREESRQKSIPSESLRSDATNSPSHLSSRSAVVRNPDEEIQHLRGQITNYRKEIEQFEDFKSDWLIEKEALEEILLKLRQQLREKSLKGNVNENKDEAEDSYVILKHERDVLVGEKVKFLEELEEQRSRVSELTKQLDEMSKDKSDDIDKAKFEEKSFVMELTEQLEQARTDTERERLKLKQIENETVMMISQLEEKDRVLIERNTTLEDLRREASEKALEVEEKRKEVEKCGKQLDEKQKEINGLTTLVGDKEEQILELESKVEELQGELGSQEESEKDVDTTEDKEKGVSELMVEMRAKQREVNVLVEEKNALLQSLEELDQQQQASNLQLMEQRDALFREKEVLRIRLEEMTKEEETGNGREENKTESCRVEVEADKNGESYSEDAKLHEEWLRKEENLNREIIKLREEIERLSTELELCDKSSDDFERTRLDLERKLERTEMSLKQAGEMMKGKEQELSSLKVEVENYASEKRLMKENEELREEQLRRYEQMISNEKMTETTNADSVARLERELAERRESEKKLGENFVDIEAKYSALCIDLDVLNEELARMTLSLQEERDCKTAVLIVLESEREKNSDKDRIIMSYEEKAKALVAQIKSLQSEEESLSNDLTLKDSEIERLRSELLRLQNDLQNSKSLIENLHLHLGNSFQDSQCVEASVSIEESGKIVQEPKVIQLTSNGKASNNLVPIVESNCTNVEKFASQELRLSKRASEEIVNEREERDSTVNKIGSSSEELELLRKMVAQKDKVVAGLKESNASLLALLDGKSSSQYGNKTLAEIKRLEKELQQTKSDHESRMKTLVLGKDQQIHDLKMEKDHMISILNEKTRECSQLKSEVHKLMNVVSAEKTALTKVQQENQDLRTIKPTDGITPNQDMSKEAIKQLSQIINDKDLEIESLSQKNGTLLQVLQSSSPEGTSVTSLLMERDNLAKQVTMFQRDREQIIVALNAKHQESVSYHAETQRLSRASEETHERLERLQRDYDTLGQQYQEKTQNLLNVQNDLFHFKQRLKEVEKLYEEELENKKREESSQSTYRIARMGRVTRSSSHVTGDDVITGEEGEGAERDVNGQKMRELVEENRELRAEREREMSEKETELSELQTKLNSKQETLRNRDSECGFLKKQNENLNFQLRGLQTELSDLRRERDEAIEKSSAVQQEIHFLREANGKLSLAVNDKDFELHALREKAGTLTQLIQDHGAGEKGEMDKLMKETEVMHQQTRALRQDRDQFVMALQQQQAENREQNNQVKKLQEQEGKLIREVERLRQHLMQVEESYTKEAVEAEEREKHLRNALATAEERISSSSLSVQSANQRASKQVESLQSQLYNMAEQRDNALAQLAACQETASQYATSLQNLQMVLEQFQQEKELQQAADIERYQREIVNCREEIKKLSEQNRQLGVELSEATNALEAAQRLSEQLDKKEEVIRALRQEVQLREHELEKSELESKKLLSITEGKVDKELVKNLMFGYFHTTSKKKNEVLLLIGKVLGFSAKEMQQLTAESSGSSGWLVTWLRRPSQAPPASPDAYSPEGSFAELFVKFLEKESTPAPTLRLPAERMAQEQNEQQQQRAKQHQQQHHAAAFNPFAASANQTLPLQTESRTDYHRSLSPSSQLFMQPFTSASLPLFPAPVAQSTPQPSPSAPERHLGGSSPQGHVTTRSSAILKDVLQGTF